MKRIYCLAEAGKGILDISRTLNDEGIANPTGKLWSKNGVHIILRNQTYTGTLVWGTRAKDHAEPVRVEKAFPAIVSKTQFRKVNRQMRSRAPKNPTPAAWEAPTCSMGWSSATSATAPYRARTQERPVLLLRLPVPDEAG